MLRLLLPAACALALAGCAAPPPPVQTASAAGGSDTALMDSFFGTGMQRSISPVLRCGVRCPVAR